MNPLHPKLRNALLNDERHPDLSESLLLEYEGLLVQLFDETYNGPDIVWFHSNYKTILAHTEKSSFKITDKTIAALAKSKVDPAYVKRLEKIKDKTFDSEQEFSNAVLEAVKEKGPRDLVADIKQFIEDFMPNFDEIHAEFIERQAEAVQDRLIDLNIAKGFSVIWKWIRAVIFGKDRWYDKRYP